MKPFWMIYPSEECKQFETREEAYDVAARQCIEFKEDRYVLKTESSCEFPGEPKWLGMRSPRKTTEAPAVAKMNKCAAKGCKFTADTLETLNAHIDAEHGSKD